MKKRQAGMPVLLTARRRPSCLFLRRSTSRGRVSGGGGGVSTFGDIVFGFGARYGNLVYFGRRWQRHLLQLGLRVRLGQLRASLSAGCIFIERRTLSASSRCSCRNSSSCTSGIDGALSKFSFGLPFKKSSESMKKGSAPTPPSSHFPEVSFCRDNPSTRP